MVLVLLGCWRIASAQYASAQPISEPTVFAPGVISTGDYEVCPQFALGEKTFYFVKSTPDANFWTIVFSRYENGKWNAPRVAPFSGQYSDADEFITLDGYSAANLISGSSFVSVLIELEIRQFLSAFSKILPARSASPA